MELRHGSGFTLIEILVVMVILGVVAAFAVSSFYSPHALRIANFAEQLKMSVELAREEAILQTEPIGLTLGKDRYQFFRYKMTFDPERGLESKWESVDNNPLLKGAIIPSFIRTELSLNKTMKQNIGTPAIVFLDNGSLTPFAVLISHDDRSPRYQLSAQQNGDIVLTKLPLVIPFK
jgi:type II secretion system protein H